MGTVSKSILFALASILTAYLYTKWKPTFSEDAHLNSIESQIAEVWSTEIKWPAKKFSRLAVGTNANVDLIVSGVDLLTKLGLSPGKQQNHNSLRSLSDLQETFSFFFSKGRAAERIFLDASVFSEVVEAASSLEEVEQFIGGNAALMAEKASSLFPDVKIQFVGPVGPILQKLMSKNISVPDASIVGHDEFHLIMEYKVGEEWGSSQAPVATRFICSYDASNSEMTMLEIFFANLHSYRPDLVLISGLHMLDGQEEDFFESRLDALVTGLKGVDVSVPVHLEFASMANAQFVKSILEKVLPRITSLGLNEQELAFASVAAGGPHSDHLENSSGQPLIHKMSDIMLWLLRTYGFSSGNKESRLSRVHFHSLTYHIVGVHNSQWRNLRSAAMAGSRIAGMQACDIRVLDPDYVDLKIPLEFQLFSGDRQRTFDPQNPAYLWTIDEFHFVFSPVLVCKHPVKTVGLGDAISATGLMFSQFVH
ncbi:hypothetical protein BaRGS_00028749 [Batillaria attramentaria]|uniref:ADP-dependent glucokinase n=1 Tax=Batillaria attramentaria TaxID=370345 RepID=A0ABD0JZD6_9CAEN